MNEWLGILQLYLRTLRTVISRPWRRRETLDAVVRVGLGSLPIVALATAFAGIVVSTEIAWHMDQALNTVDMIPGITGQFILRELGIAIPALLLAAKAGASTTAEIGTMKVTEQLDALKLLGIDEVEYLVVPRFLGSILSLVCLTTLSVAITLLMSGAVAVSRFHFLPQEYWNAVLQFIEIRDISGALIKSAVFGSVIPVISASYGFTCRGGAEGVGNATTLSVVASTVAIIFLDFLLTFLFMGPQ
jgi:phospholipid/cholesterol/gamma-HCH transport system permease protein